MARATIESTIANVRRMMATDGRELPLGHRLRVPRPEPVVPTAGQICQLYQTLPKAAWPLRPWVSTGDWWHALLAVACWTGFRRSDLARLAWKDIGPDTICLTSGKTGHRHQIPVTPLVTRHLEPLLGGALTVFDMPRSTSYRACYRELHKASARACIPPVTLQQLRRFSITMWSAANAEAGRIIHGCSLGVMSHYVDPYQILRSAAHLVDLPQCFLSAHEKEQSARMEAELLDRWRRASPDQRRVMLDVSRLTG